jgi:TPR repeat protein
VGRFGLLLALVLLVWCGPARGESFDDGLRAFRGGEPDRALDIWLPLAEAGDAAAQYSLGKLFEHGEGPVGQDVAKAVQWYRAAAAQGLPAAQNNLGLMYAQGRGVPSDLTRAIEIWRAAAQQSYPWAQYNLGLAYFRGQGVPVDQSEAADWFRRAADGGLAEAQFIMGQLRREGLGLEKDEGRALAWYDRAVEQGHPRARKHAELLAAAGVESKPPEMPGASVQDVTTGRQVPAGSKSPKGDSARTQPRVAVQTVPKTSSNAKAGSDAKATPRTKSTIKAKPKTEAAPRPQAKAKAEPEQQAKAVPKAKAKAEPQAKEKTKAKAEAEARPQPQRPETKTEPVFAAEPLVAEEPLASAQARPRPETPPAPDPSATQTAAVTQGAGGLPDPKAKGSFRIWLASAGNEAKAAKLWQTVRDRHPEVFSGTEVTFAAVDLGAQTLVRVLVGPLASAEAAEGLCERLRSAEPDAFCKVRSD